MQLMTIATVVQSDWAGFTNRLGMFKGMFGLMRVSGDIGLRLTSGYTSLFIHPFWGDKR